MSVANERVSQLFANVLGDYGYTPKNAYNLSQK